MTKRQNLWSGVPGFKQPQPSFVTGPVSKSREETALIRAALADFGPSGPRRHYADWLNKTGQTERAAVVMATLSAYETGDIDHLTNLPSDNSWSRLLAVPLLKTLIKGTSDLSEFNLMKALILPHLEPALSLDYSLMEKDPPIGTTRLWGLPDLSPDTVWPTLSDCSDEIGGLGELPQNYPCGFVGQFAWADFKGTVFGEDLPDKGGLLIFGFSEVHELGIMETVLRPWDPDAKLDRRLAPEPLLKDIYGNGMNSPQSPHRLTFTDVLSLPDARDGPFQDILPGFSWSDEYYELYEACHEACGENCFGFGGYLSGTSGSDPSPSSDWRRLAVLRINPEAGVLHFAIPKTDLKDGKLDNARYVWMDWDG